MKAKQRTDTIRFTVKGQVVIPRWLRKEFGIEEARERLFRPRPMGFCSNR
jgi:bifunctional DNA-binding transcriptional regulator/antitoxin component of YhaV-PrlF toxin-antitoxin module